MSDTQRAGFNVLDYVARDVPTQSLKLCRERSLRVPALVAQAASCVPMMFRECAGMSQPELAPKRRSRTGFLV
jgi:hypothetical protein